MGASRSVIESLIWQAGARGPCHWQQLGRGMGGCFWRVSCEDSSWFAKTQIDVLEMYSAEADGLEALRACGAVQVPRVLGYGEQDTESYLVMEWLELGEKTAVAAACLGEGLAHQHQTLGNGFGWRRNNFIGTTPQFNTLSDDWVDFFRDHRLGFQLRLAAENGYLGQLQEHGAALLEKLPVLFAGYSPKPALLHGDLWSGNWGVLRADKPVIFDPAVHYGDRECDLAMTQLFGGFPSEFYAAYNHHLPLEVNYLARSRLYKLYHVLNHLNLFGNNYLALAQELMEQLMSDIRG